MATRGRLTSFKKQTVALLYC
ncbi:MAG: hypothetical protein RL040_1515, partial [Bacteroidota bacterium]